MRVRAPQERGVEHAGAREVAHVAPRPVRSRGSSTRLTARRSGARERPGTPSAPASAGRAQAGRGGDRLDDALVAGAAAEDGGRAPPGSPSRSAPGCSRSSSSAVMSMPGVQKPHCSPWCSWNASWSGWSAVRRRPSTVMTSAPSAWTASIRQERTASPSTRTVHAPQTPCSQPTWVPVRPRSSRRKSTRSLRQA